MYQNKVIAVFGASQDPAKYGYKIFSTLRALSMQVYGINPKGGEVEGQPFFTNLAALPVAADVAVLVIPPVALVQAVEQCIQGGVKEIWFQPGARSPEAFERAQHAGIKAINGCFMAENGFW